MTLDIMFLAFFAQKYIQSIVFLLFAKFINNLILDFSYLT